jgi:hypothetical protein
LQIKSFRKFLLARGRIDNPGRKRLPIRKRLRDHGPPGSGPCDAYDNALAESVIGLFETELIKPRGPGRTAEQVELATLEYVD